MLSSGTRATKTNETMIGLDIIYEDEQIVVVNKAAGIGTQAPRKFDSLEARIRAYLGKSSSHPYLGIPHRLDRCASGVMVFAKRRKAAQRLALQFERREVQKIYAALVSGKVSPKAGEWQDYMRKIPDKPRAEIVSSNHADARLAILAYEVTCVDQDVSRLQIQLQTGRMHQIRLQCGSRGFPILGDAMYGSAVVFGGNVDHERERQIALHARSLKLVHPRTRELMQFEAAFPNSWPRS